MVRVKLQHKPPLLADQVPARSIAVRTVFETVLRRVHRGRGGDGRRRQRTAHFIASTSPLASVAARRIRQRPPSISPPPVHAPPSEPEDGGENRAGWESGGDTFSVLFNHRRPKCHRRSVGEPSAGHAGNPAESRSSSIGWDAPALAGAAGFHGSRGLSAIADFSQDHNRELRGSGEDREGLNRTDDVSISEPTIAGIAGAPETILFRITERIGPRLEISRDAGIRPG